MGEKMKTAPIYYGVVQVRFNAVLAMEQYAPAIQDSFRKTGFPDYQRSLVAVLNFMSAAPGTQNAPTPALQPTARHLFLNEERTVGFELDQSSLLFHTTNYETFERFSATFLDGMSIVHRAAELSYFDRVGLRFLDAVCPGPKESLADYLAPNVLGIFEKLEPRELIQSFSETRTKSGNTTLVSRAIISNQVGEGVGYPADLQQNNLAILERFKNVTGLYAIVDTDSFIEERERFDIATLEKRLMLLHSDAERSFNAMVTPHAIKTWK